MLTTRARRNTGSRSFVSSSRRCVILPAVQRTAECREHALGRGLLPMDDCAGRTRPCSRWLLACMVNVCVGTPEKRGDDLAKAGRLAGVHSADVADVWPACGCIRAGSEQRAPGWPQG